MSNYQFSTRLLEDSVGSNNFIYNSFSQSKPSLESDENEYMTSSAATGFGGYYPDSDLETIAEESSIIDSEISHHTKTDGDSDSTLDGSPLKSRDTMNGSGNYLNHQQHAVLPPEQKIVFAKCLPGNKRFESRGHQRLMHLGKMNKDSPTDMFEAARSGNLKALNQFSMEDLCGTIDEKGNTVLHVAAEMGHLECLQMLITSFSSEMLSLPNDDILTATGLAIKYGHIKCVQWLIENTSARDELLISRLASNIDGFSMRSPAAHVAAMFDREEILDWLCEEMLKDGISVDVANHTSDSAIHTAARYGNIKCVQALVARGASVTILNSQGETPAQAAQKEGFSVCVGYLVVVETCVSLAQQVVALKSDLENLQEKYNSLEGRSIDRLPQRTDKVSNDEVQITKHFNGPLKKHSDAKTTPRKTLQQQPPPPKIWLLNKKETEQKNVSNLQQESTIEPIAKETVENKTNLKEESEIENITKDLSSSKMPWENLTIDEILRRARQIRYQPSPSVSHMTEDSTMEPVEVMKDRLAAASRWLLVENGKNSFGMNNRKKTRLILSSNENHLHKLTETTKLPEKSSTNSNIRDEKLNMKSNIKNFTSVGKSSERSHLSASTTNSNKSKFSLKYPSNESDMKLGSFQNLPTQQHALLVTKSTKPVDIPASVNSKVSHEAQSNKIEIKTYQNQPPKFVPNQLKERTGKGDLPKQKIAPGSSRQLNSSTQRSGSYRRAVWSAPFVRSDAERKTETNKQITRLDLGNSMALNSEEKNKNGTRTSSLWAKPTNINSSQTSGLKPNITENRTKPKSYNWVNSYFKNKSSSSSSLHQADDEVIDVSEAPEIRTEITPRQNSFLRKVQGKRKTKT